VIISRAIFVALSISFEAQVVINSFQKKISSATLPQYKVESSSKYLAFETRSLSLSGKNQVTHKAHHLEIIETL
jgi:subtilase family serine protease